MSRLSELILQLKRENPELGKEIEKEVRHLQDRRAFGLNFERHRPETVELYGRPVRKGDKVKMLPPRGETKAPDDRLWIVAGAKKVEGARVATLKDRRTDETAEYPLDDLVVVAESHDTIYPGLVSTGKIERGGDKPFHTVINGENLHALKVLLYTHRGKIDCIYIDPPYNTGNDSWIYNDNYVAADDMFKHSKWLAFIERRLLLAKELLSDTGVIIVSIGNEEHHHLRMLMDQVFGSENFISNVVWQGRVKGSPRFTAGGVDYMLFYAKRLEAVSDAQITWREPKAGVTEARAMANSLWTKHRPDNRAATAAMKRWMTRQDFEAGVSRYSFIDDHGRLHRDGVSLAAPDDPNGRRPRYQVLHPETGKPCKVPALGWRWSEQRMKRELAAGNIMFGEDESTIPALKKYIDDADTRVPPETFSADRFTASSHLNDLVPGKRFPFPKNHEVLMRWLRMVAPTDATILDFFGGSGSTSEAVMRLNEEDGGRRQCILITNNEVTSQDAKALSLRGLRRGDQEWETRGICRYVAEPRMASVITGERPDGSRHSDGLKANVEFLDLTYEAPLGVATHHAFTRIAPMLWLRAGATGRRIDDLEKGWDVADTYGVMADLDQLEDFLDAVNAGIGVKIAYIVTDDDRQFAATCSALPEHVEPVQLYESYLRNFQIDARRSSR